MATKEGSSLVRLDDSTRALLDEYRADLEALAEQGRVQLPAPETSRHGRVGYDWIVRHLINKVRQHRYRARKQRLGAADRRRDALLARARAALAEGERLIALQR